MTADETATAPTVPTEEARDQCSWWPTGGCSASVDGYCIGGTYEGKCFG